MIHVRDAARDGIEHLEGADELSRSKDLNFKATAGDRRDRAAKSFSAGAKTGKPFRPAHYHLELPGALGDVGTRNCGRYTLNSAVVSQKLPLHRDHYLPVTCTTSLPPPLIVSH